MNPTANLNRDSTERVENRLRDIIGEQQLPTLWVATTKSRFGTFVAVTICARRLFDRRERLRLDRLHSEESVRIGNEKLD